MLLSVYSFRIQVKVLFLIKYVALVFKLLLLFRNLLVNSTLINCYMFPPWICMCGVLNSLEIVRCLIRIVSGSGVHTQTFVIAGYVQKITARTDIEVMEDLDNGKPP